MFPGRDFLTVERALRQFEGEAFDRTSIGRLYYAIFLESRQFCETSFGFQRRKMAREHQAVIDLLSRHDAAFSDSLRTLRALRNMADYDDHISADEIVLHAENAREIAAYLMLRLDILRNSTPQ